MIAVILALAAMGACRRRESAGPPPGKRVMQFPVEVATVESRAVEYAVHAVGTIDVFEHVQITARVAGAIEKLSFREGEVVKPGHVLAAIDPARFALASRQAAAAMDSAKAALADAETGLARREQVDRANPGVIPGEELATWRTKVATAKAELAQRQVAKEQAALDLADAYVEAPIGGDVQTRNVETGQYVQVGAVIATMVRRDPLQLHFKVPEADAARFGKSATVAFTVEGGPKSYRAVVRHVAAVADPTSRTVAVLAQIDDPDHAALRPGGFAQVVIPVGGNQNAPVVPESAVRPSEKGFLAYVVDGDVVRERIVELGLRTSDGLVEIKQGLAVGDRLVVRGAEALRDGAPVRVVEPGRAAGMGSGTAAGPSQHGNMGSGGAR